MRFVAGLGRTVQANTPRYLARRPYSTVSDQNRESAVINPAGGGVSAFPKGGQMMLGHHANLLCPPACPKTRPDEKRPDPEPDCRILPAGRYGGDDLRPPRRE